MGGGQAALGAQRKHTGPETLRKDGLLLCSTCICPCCWQERLGVCQPWHGHWPLSPTDPRVATDAPSPADLQVATVPPVPLTSEWPLVLQALSPGTEPEAGPLVPPGQHSLEVHKGEV